MRQKVMPVKGDPDMLQQLYRKGKRQGADIGGTEHCEKAFVISEIIPGIYRSVYMLYDRVTEYFHWVHGIYDPQEF